ncbi:hypothetical protein DFH28DRAFT_1173440, partial [Melampsora americana]
LIRKTSPVKHRGDLFDVPHTRARFNAIHKGVTPAEDQNDDPDEADGMMARPPLGIGHVSKGAADGSAGRSQRDSISANPNTSRVNLEAGGQPTTATSPSNSINVTPANHRHPFPRITHAEPRNTSIPPDTDQALQVLIPPPQSPAVERPKDHSPNKRKTDPKTTTPRMRWGEPGELDVVALSHLVSFEPFSAGKKEVLERFLNCSKHLKASRSSAFTLIYLTRYDNLKSWVKRADARSAGASGTQEEDGELRELIHGLMDEEEVSW